MSHLIIGIAIWAIVVALLIGFVAGRKETPQ